MARITRTEAVKVSSALTVILTVSAGNISEKRFDKEYQRLAHSIKQAWKKFPLSYRRSILSDLRKTELLRHSVWYAYSQHPPINFGRGLCIRITVDSKKRKHNHNAGATTYPCGCMWFTHKVLRFPKEMQYLVLLHEFLHVYKWSKQTKEDKEEDELWVQKESCRLLKVSQRKHLSLQFHLACG